MSEQQRVAIVTGAAGGIGRELVLGLLGKELKIAAVGNHAECAFACTMISLWEGARA